MIPFLPTSVASAEASESALARATEAGSSASLQPQGGYSETLPPGLGGGRSPEAVGFPAVLLALASLGTPLQAMPVADAPKGDSPTAGVEGAGPPASPYMEVEAAEEVDATEGIDAKRGLELARPWVVALPADGAAVDMDGEGLGQVAAPADTVTLDGRMLANLSGDFSTRLERVADRMWSEFGVRLEIVEGYRTQARQDSLFQQGRTEPGQVVTWTRNSLHSLGAAADVYVDGAPIQPTQAATLFRIAGEEGLKTLYPYDAGHVQLQGLDDFAGPEGPLLREGRPAVPGAATPPIGVARVAPVAPVARPARPGGVVLGPEFDAAVTPLDQGVASVGTDQRIARGTSESTVALPDAPGRRSGPSALSALSSSSEPATPPSESAGRSDQRGAASPNKGAVSAGAVDANLPHSDDTTEAPRFAGEETATNASTSAVRQSVDASVDGLAAQTASPVAGDRTTVGRVAAQQSVPDPGPIHDAVLTRTAEGLVYRRMHVPIEAGTASLDLGIRPGGVDALLNISDPQLASDLQKNLHQLRQVLADRGVEARGLTVRLVSDQTPDIAVRGVEAASGASSNDGLVSSSHSDRHRGRQEALRDRAEERNQQSRSQRDRQEDEKS